MSNVGGDIKKGHGYHSQGKLRLRVITAFACRSVLTVRRRINVPTNVDVIQHWTHE